MGKLRHHLHSISPNRDGTYDLLGPSPDTLPVSYRGFLEQKPPNQVYATNVLVYCFDSHKSPVAQKSFSHIQYITTCILGTFFHFTISLHVLHCSGLSLRFQVAG